jgi:hypothetical protein
VTLLKNGDTKVYKKDLKNRYKLSKEFLYEFTLRHPEVLKAYKKSIRSEGTPIADQEIERLQRVPRERARHPDNVLNDIPPGRENANEYHDFILGVLTEIFHPSLTHPIKEQPVDDGRKRIDIVYNNSSERGFFSRLVRTYKIHCPYIHVECKNYAEDPANPELDQLLGRFSRKRGKFGILVCRKVRDPELLLKRLQDVVNNTEGAIMVLEDSDILQLLALKAADRSQEIDDYLEAKLRPILM